MSVATVRAADAHAHAPALPRPRPRRKPAARPLARPRPFGGVLWIVVLGALLAGVVAVNVAVLQLNVRLDDLGRERIQLRADNARLSSQLSSAAAAARIEAQARKRLGLVPADPSTTAYVQLAPTSR
ncbi:MAG: cell division protein FtsL [Actinobacteria bacterium]|nr:cell division protein FtsL [Actinomycetota bacterium]